MKRQATQNGSVVRALLVAAVVAAAAAPACATSSDSALSTGGGTTSGTSPCARAGESKCGDVCVDTSTDPEHCGSCLINCLKLPGADATTATCEAGKCVLGACDASHADCNGLASDGCETDATEADNCGGCGVACADPTPICIKNEATGTYGCASGCPAATPTLCGAECVDLESDPLHCGKCATSCGAQALEIATCTAGVCGSICEAGAHKCGATCVSDLSPASCGASCAPCAAPANGTATCDGIACGVACDPGYTSVGAACVDVDECQLGTSSCSQDATCTNTIGSYDCACKPGFTGDGFMCVDANECSLNTDDCDVNAICQDVPGGFTCTCKPGYEGDGHTCTNVDECALGTDNCDVVHAACTDTVGGFTCKCDAGFTGNGVVCTDINECALNTDNCNFNANCTNTPGGFTCACKTGYEGDGLTCFDVDECTLGTSTCIATETCLNTQGGFICDCEPPNALCGNVCSNLATDEAHCGGCATPCAAEKVCISGVCVGSGNLRVTLVWSRKGDLDLHLLTPNNKHIFFGNKGPSASTDNGWLDHDDLTDRGPENIYWDSIYTPPSGVYNICVIAYNFSPDATPADPVAFNLTIARPNLPEQNFDGIRTSDGPDSVCTIMSPNFVTSFTYP